MSGDNLPNLPTVEDAMDAWAGPVAALDGLERDLHIANKMTAIEGIVDNPRAECLAALARVSGNGSEPSAASAFGPKAFKVLRRADVTLSRPDWIMPGRMVRGGLCVIGGKQGDGKGKMTRDLNARMTRGGPLPFDPATRFKPLTCIDFNAEDNPAEVIFPEYEAAGADFERLTVVHRREDGKFPDLSDAGQLEQLKSLVHELHADVVSIDPVGHFFPGIKFNETESVLANLGPVMRLAEELRILFVLTTHFNKAGASDALTKFLGSGQWTAIARSALGVVPDPDCDDEDRERRQLWTVKCNLAPKRERRPWGFELTSDAQGVVRVVWDANAATSSESAAFRLEGGRGRSNNSKQDKAREWLLGHLEAGTTYRAMDLYEEGKADGHEPWAVKKALGGSPDFDSVTLSLGYKKGTHAEWYLAGTRSSEGESE